MEYVEAKLGSQMAQAFRNSIDGNPELLDIVVFPLDVTFEISCLVCASILVEGEKEWKLFAMMKALVYANGSANNIWAEVGTVIKSVDAEVAKVSFRMMLTELGWKQVRFE